MSEARERLIGAAGRPLGVSRSGNRAEVLGCLDAFLSRPDDLLAVLVEEGVLEWEWEQPDSLQERRPVYRRTEEARP